MYLCEEYLIRHGCTVRPVRHVKSGVLFVKENNEWIIVKIDWKDKPTCPGEYSFSLYKQKYNCPIFVLTNKLNMGWHEFEDFILSWCKIVKGQPIVLKEEVYLSAWEMFLIANDEKLAAALHPNRIYPTIDDNFSVKERYAYLSQVINYLSIHHADIYEFWKNKMLPLIEDYSYWLGTMVHENSNKKILSGTGKKPNL